MTSIAEFIKSRIIVAPMEGHAGAFIATADFSDLFDGDKEKILRKAASSGGSGTGVVVERLTTYIFEWITDVIEQGADHPHYRPGMEWIVELPDRIKAT